MNFISMSLVQLLISASSCPRLVLFLFFSVIQPFGASAQTGTRAPSPGLANDRAVQNIRVGNQILELHKLPDSKVFKGASGREISVARLRQLQARLAAPAPVPVKAAPNQSLQQLAATPGTPRIQLANGRIVQVQQLSQIAKLTARLKQQHAPAAPVPQSRNGVQPKSTVGPTFALAEAIKRPGNEPIKVGRFVYTADELKLIDAKLRASLREPRGLTDHVSANGRRGAIPTVNVSGPQTRVPRGTSLKSMLSKADNTVLVSPSGRTITVGQIKAHLQSQGLTVEQAQEKYQHNHK